MIFMLNNSIFEFLNSEKIFKDIYELCLDMEKVTNLEAYNASLNLSRVIIEGLCNHIIINIEEDNQLSKKFYKKKNNRFVGLKEIVTTCKRKKYISAEFERRLIVFLDSCGNAGSHFTNKKFKLEDVKKVHHLIFDFSLFTFKKINPSFEKEYEFDLSYIKADVAGETITLEDFKKILNTFNINEFSIEDVFNKMNEMESNIDSRLSIHENEIDQIDINFNEFKDKQITLSQIEELIQKNNNEFKDEILNSIKNNAENMMKGYLKDLIGELRNKVTLVDNNHKIIDVPDYEVVRTDNNFEIREIEEIIGVPEDCPKCSSKIPKGSTSCGNCGYSFFDELNKKCPKCGKRVPMGAKKCVRCNADLQRHICSKCGYENKEDSKFCVKCGNRL